MEQHQIKIMQNLTGWLLLVSLCLPRRYARCVSVVTCDSVSVDVGSSRAVFGPGIVGMGDAGIGYYTFGSDGDVRDGCFSVRPVVSLKSNITESEIAITTGAETDWTIIQQPPAPPAWACQD